MIERIKASLKARRGLFPRRMVLHVMRRHYQIGKEISEEKLDYYDKCGVELGSLEFKKYLKAGLLSNCNRETIERAKAYQTSTIGRNLDPILHIAYNNMFKRDEIKLLPRSFYWNHLIPYLNDSDYIFSYSDKNYYTISMKGAEQPETVLKNINGTYFDASDQPIPRSSLPDYLRKLEDDYILKPSRMDDGHNIRSLTRGEAGFLLENKLVDWNFIEKYYGANFLVQKKLVQHPMMAEPHPDSVNTLRILTLRWEGEIHFLLAFARFGSGGSLNDNAGTGGVCVGIDDSGHMMDYAVNASASMLYHHPTSGYQFSKRQAIPAFSEAKQVCLDMHQKILHHHLVSWDIAIRRDETPVLIESNFRGSLWLYQLVTGKPILGDFSDPILKAMRQTESVP